MRARGSLLVGGLAVLSLLASACGGSTSPSVANVTTTSPVTSAIGTTGAPVKSFAGFAACMEAHGVGASTGPDGHGVMINGDASPSTMAAASKACGDLLPGGEPAPLTQAQVAQRTQELRAFAQCMRSHNLPGFPDPDSQGEFPGNSLNGIDPSSPFLSSAWTACRSLFPTLGPQMRF